MNHCRSGPNVYNQMFVAVSVQVLLHPGIFLKHFFWLITVSLQESEMNYGPLHVATNAGQDFHPLRLG